MLQNFCGSTNQVQAWKSTWSSWRFQEEITDKLSDGKPNIWLVQRPPSATQTEPFNRGWLGRHTPASWPGAGRPNRLGARSPKSAHFPCPHAAASSQEQQIKKETRDGQIQKAPKAEARVRLRKQRAGRPRAGLWISAVRWCTSEAHFCSVTKNQEPPL